MSEVVRRYSGILAPLCSNPDCVCTAKWVLESIKTLHGVKIVGFYYFCTDHKPTVKN